MRSASPPTDRANCYRRTVAEAPRIYVACPRDDYCLASIPALPGCIASGKTRDEAVANARRAWSAYLDLLDARGVSVDHWKDASPEEFAVLDTPASGVLDDDEGPMEEHELRDFLHVFEAQQAALLALVRGLPAEELQRAPDDTTWSVRRALEHVMTGTLDILSKLEQWPDDGFASLQAAHRVAFQRFSVMEADDTRHETVIHGRRWTVRRVMRRLLEHEWEHYRHIEEIIAKLGRKPEQ